MATLKNLALLVLVISSFATLATAARELELPQLQPLRHGHHTLEARLAKGLAVADGAGLVDCWNALMELRSCTNEIVLFFLNGESYLGQPCCRAIRTITHRCWPAMLASLGFTAQEGDILRGYCDAETAPPSQPPPPPPPSTAPPASPPAGDVAEIVI